MNNSSLLKNNSLPHEDGEGPGMGVKALPPSVPRQAQDTFPVFTGKKHQKTQSVITKRARELRTSATPAERLLWEYLRKNKLGVKFRRQHPIVYFNKHTRHCFIADFACLEKKLIIEVDGEIHTKTCAREYDETRTIIINQFEFKVLRINNNTVLFKISEVILQIRKALFSSP